MELRRYSVLGALLICVTALALPGTASAAGGKKGKGKGKTAAAAESSDADKSADAADSEGAEAPAEEEYVEPDAWERPPVEEEPPPEPKAKKKPEKEVHGDGRNVGIGLLIGYGFEHGTKFGSNPYSLGFGLRGGYTLDFGLYLGGSFSYFIGSSDEGDSGGGSGTAGLPIEQSSNYIEFLAEVGYDLWLAKFVLRPYIGLGVGVASLDRVGGPTVYPSPVSSFAFAPGLSLFYNINAVFIGADLRFNMMGGNGVDGTVVSLLGGMRF